MSLVFVQNDDRSFKNVIRSVLLLSCQSIYTLGCFVYTFDIQFRYVVCDPCTSAVPLQL